MGVIEISWNVSPILATVACFIGYTLIDGNKLTPQIAFVSLALFHMMKRSATSLPFMISNAIRSFVSMRRISEFLDSVELDESHIKRGIGEQIVAIENGSFTWDSFDDPSSTKHLQNIDLSIHKGELIGVVGRVGSGKSSLLAAISGEMHRLEGSCKVVSSSIGYVPQQSWIQNKTLKDNVLFYKLYDEDYYNKTIDTCALRDDLKMLSAGDMTEIGERGINLSGGQKARVALARAVYQKSDLYILDDTLSAVDSHVGNHIFENVIGPNGLLKDTTRIFALNSLAFLRYCDRLVVMQDGKINEIGTYDELLSKPDGAFAEWMREHAKKLIEQRKSRESTIEEDAEIEDILRELSIPSTPASVIIRRFSSMEATEGKFSRQVSNMSVKSTITEVSAHQPQMTHNSPPVEGQLIEDEYTEVGKVSWRMYWDYIQAFGAMRMASYIFVLFFMSSATEALSNIWLAKWSSESEQNPNDPKNLIIYGTSSIFTCIAVGAAGFIFAWGTFKASLKFHDSLVHSLLKSPMSFFDTTPLGRILNRISNDIEKVDQEIPANFSYSLLIINAVFVSIVTIIIVIPGLLIIAIPLFVLFIKLVRYYTATSVQIRRLFKKSWSLVLSYVQDAYIGADSLRVFNATDRSKNQMRQISDMSIETTHTEITCNQWIQVRLEMLTQIVIFGFILVAIYLGDHKIISMGILALVITNGETFSGNLGNIARQWKKAEMSIVSVERINEYVNNKHEAPWEIESSRPPNNWPASRQITFNNLCLKYREDTELVLKHLNFVIKGGEKVGIVGRTGAEQAHLKQFVVNFEEKLDYKINESGSNLSVGQRQLVCLARALLRKNTRILVLDEATAAVDVETDRLIQDSIRQYFGHCTILTIAHRLNTILDYDKILVMDAGEVREFETPRNLLSNPHSLFSSLAKNAGITVELL
uniref:Uncharacterized protein n=1 Tax=Acrobeloides nanus TaxID=290746 RepID=A0A914CJU3_9BILA